MAIQAVIRMMSTTRHRRGAGGRFARVDQGGSMALNTEHERRMAVDQMLANWRIEGFIPDAGYTALVDQYVAGTLTLRELGEQVKRRRGLSDQTAP